MSAIGRLADPLNPMERQHGWMDGRMEGERAIVANVAANQLAGIIPLWVPRPPGGGVEVVQGGNPCPSRSPGGGGGYGWSDAPPGFDVVTTTRPQPCPPYATPPPLASATTWPLYDRSFFFFFFTFLVFFGAATKCAMCYVAWFIFLRFIFHKLQKLIL